MQEQGAVWDRRLPTIPLCSPSPTFYTVTESDFSYKREDSKYFRHYEPHLHMVFAEILFLLLFFFNNPLKVKKTFKKNTPFLACTRTGAGPIWPSSSLPIPILEFQKFLSLLCRVRGMVGVGAGDVGGQGGHGRMLKLSCVGPICEINGSGPC